MRLLLGFIFSVLIFSEALAQNAVRVAEPPSEAALFNGVIQKINSVLGQCPARIWPSLSQWKLNVLLVSRNQGALLWRYADGKTEVVPESEIAANLRYGSYQFLKFRGVETVAAFIYGDYFNTVDSLYDLIAHEGFHYFGQRGWVREQQGERGTVFPAQSAPRIERRLIFDRIKSFVTSRGTNSLALAQAAYWNQQWMKDHPQEKKSTTDGYEGTARYFDMVSNALSRVGCDASEAELLKAVEKNLATRLGYSVDGKRFDLSNEGYDIGGIATLALRFHSRDPEWHVKIQKGKTPVEVLLADVVPAEEPMDVNLKALFEQNIFGYNKSIEALLDKDLSLLRSQDVIFIGFSYEALKSSYSTFGHYILAEDPGVLMMPLAADLTFQGSTWTATVLKSKVAMGMNQNPCPQVGFVIALKPEVVRGLGSMQISISDSLLSAQLSGKSVVDSKGRSWFCAQ